LLWEASDRICGKRLKALLPTLVRPWSVTAISPSRPRSAPRCSRSARRPSTALCARSASGRRRLAPARHAFAIRRSIPVRTFSDWGDPPPGFVEADLVAHSGPTTSGAFVQTLVLTDIATGWTECAPLLVREQTLLVGVLTQLRALMPFPLLAWTWTTTPCS
jgi:hypothetical protein